MKKLFSVRRLCKLFGHKPDNHNIADFICLWCGEHVVVEWPRPPAYKPARKKMVERIEVMEVRPGDMLVVTLMPGLSKQEMAEIQCSLWKMYPESKVLIVGYAIKEIHIVREVEK